ncbi:MAG: HAD family hydrolase [Parcubacteria group bacterium]|nr:HAD family hydrolase [Parcubacteria group bacterium]
MKKNQKQRVDWKHIKLIICDWDGVITVLGELFRRNLERAACECELSLAPVREVIDGIWAGEIEGEHTLRGNIRKMWPAISEQHIKKYIRALEVAEKEHPYPRIPGSASALKKLKKKEIRLALCTANSRHLLDARFESVAFCSELFDVISTPDNFSAGVGKPHPYALEYILKKTGFKKEQALFVGDWTPDLLAARAAGVLFIGVRSGGMSEDALISKGVPKEHIFKNLEAFVKFFLKKQKKQKEN